LDSRLALFGEVKKIFILADNDASLKFGVPANLAVEGVAQASLQDVLAVETALAKIWGEASR
jgi:hypothetical protein